MQHFDNSIGKRRMLDISSMKVSEIEEYYYQFTDLDEAEKQRRSSKLRDIITGNNRDKDSIQWILAVKTKAGKIIGKMDVFSFDDNDQCHIMLEIPNENYILKYGAEAVDQFIKICKEKKYFSEISLQQDSRSIAKYMSLHGIAEDTVIKVA